jgi:SAM-dependent methyltransferase
MYFFKSCIDSFPELFSGKVIDIGALDINGGPHRLLISSEYEGVDVAEGKNVTLVSKGEDVDRQSNYFDVSMSSECFEHNPSWRATLYNMIRMTKPLGLVVFSCASNGRPEHGTSRSDGGSAAPLTVQQGQEYYQNVSRSMVLSVLDQSQFQEFRIYRNLKSCDLYFIGIKAPHGDSLEMAGPMTFKLSNLDKKLRRYLRNQNLHALILTPQKMYALAYQAFHFSPGYKHFVNVRRLWRAKP